MAKQRGNKGNESKEYGTAKAPESQVAKAVDPTLLDQSALGNAVLQARMEGQGPVSAPAGPGLDVVAAVAQPLVRRAMAALQLDAADASRLERRVEILSGSRLPERESLIDQLHGDESMRLTVQGLLEQHFGGHDASVRQAVDGVLASVDTALSGQETEGAWTDAQGAVTLSEGATQGTLDARAAGLIADLAEARAPQAGREAASAHVGTSTASLVRSLALMVLLDEEEDEEREGAWADVELS